MGNQCVPRNKNYNTNDDIADIGRIRQESLQKKQDDFGKFSDIDAEGVAPDSSTTLKPNAPIAPVQEPKNEAIPAGLTMAENRDEDDATLDAKDFNAPDKEKKTTFKMKREASDVKLLDSGKQTVIFRDESDDEENDTTKNNKDQQTIFEGESSVVRGMGSIAFGPDD